MGKPNRPCDWSRRPVHPLPAPRGNVGPPELCDSALAGLRISEALDLRWRDVNLPARKLRVTGSKTDAGVREVDLTPTLAELLTEYRVSGTR
jgi:integrase